MASFAQVVPIREQFAAAGPTDNQTRCDVAVSDAQLAEALALAGQPEQARDHVRQAVVGRKVLMAADQGNVMYLRNAALVYRRVAEAHMMPSVRRGVLLLWPGAWLLQRRGFSKKPDLMIRVVSL